MSGVYGDGTDPGARAIILADRSGGTEASKELGGLRGVVLGIIEAVKGLRVTKMRTGFLEPRSVHVASTGKPLDATLPGIPDDRFSFTVLSDTAHGFGSFLLTTDPASPFLNDWGPLNKSTRFIEGGDPRGATAIAPQLLKIIDVPGGQYTAAIVLGPTIAAADGSQAPAGFVFSQRPSGGAGGTTSSGASASPITAPWSSFFTINSGDATGKGRDGTPSSLLSARTDAHWDDLSGHCGPLPFKKAALPSLTTPSSPKYYEGFLYPAADGKSFRLATAVDSSGGGTSGGSASAPFNPIDGNITIDGSTTHFRNFPGGYPGGVNAYPIVQAAYLFSLGSPPQYLPNDTKIYFSTRSIYCDTLTIAAGCTLIPVFGRIHCKTLLGSGKISVSPGVARGTAYYLGGAYTQVDTAPTYMPTGATTGGAGQVTTGNAGVQVPDGTHEQTGFLDGSSNFYGQSGDGGTGHAAGGHGINTGHSNSAYGMAAYEFPFPQLAVSTTMPTGTSLKPSGGASGGGGGGDNVTDPTFPSIGGYGGCGAGVLDVVAIDSSGFSGTFEADGQDGAAGFPGLFADGQAGGGGGGGGGLVRVATATASPGWSTSVKGGHGGAAGSAGGTVGADGTDGLALAFKLL